MTTWMTLLMLFLAASLASVAILATVLAYRIQIRLMRISCERLGIPPIIMENKPEPEKERAVKKDTRARLSIPIPGAQLFRKPLTDRKQ